MIRVFLHNIFQLVPVLLVDGRLQLIGTKIMHLVYGTDERRVRPLGCDRKTAPHQMASHWWCDDDDDDDEIANQSPNGCGKTEYKTA